MRVSMRAPRPMGKKLSYKPTPVKNMSGKIRRPKPPASKAGYTMNGKKLH